MGVGARDNITRVHRPGLSLLITALKKERPGYDDHDSDFEKKQQAWRQKRRNSEIMRMNSSPPPPSNPNLKRPVLPLWANMGGNAVNDDCLPTTNEPCRNLDRCWLVRLLSVVPSAGAPPPHLSPRTISEIVNDRSDDHVSYSRMTYYLSSNVARIFPSSTKKKKRNNIVPAPGSSGAALSTSIIVYGNRRAAELMCQNVRENLDVEAEPEEVRLSDLVRACTTTSMNVLVVFGGKFPVGGVKAEGRPFQGHMMLPAHEESCVEVRQMLESLFQSPL